MQLYIENGVAFLDRWMNYHDQRFALDELYHCNILCLE